MGERYINILYCSFFKPKIAFKNLLIKKCDTNTQLEVLFANITDTITDLSWTLLYHAQKQFCICFWMHS